jgi:hypothetical protein
MRATTFAMELRPQQVKLQGHALKNTKEKNWCRCDFLIEDARAMLNSLQLWRVNHVRRDVNGVAYRPAK